MPGHNNIDYAGATDVGIRRNFNQDSFTILTAKDAENWFTRGHIFLVADGMGAHNAGELASKLAADSIPHLYSKLAKQEEPEAALRRAFLETNSNIHTRGQQNEGFEGMGTTSTALVLRPEGAWISHVGDSRVYRIRDACIEQLSFDHSLLWEMAKRQNCSPDELPGIPTNVIVRSLGPEPLVQVDVEGPHSVSPGDTFLLCSDGLSGLVAEAEIGVIASILPPQEACDLLIALANLHGGPDNITAVIVRIEESEDSSDSIDTSSWADIRINPKSSWADQIFFPLALTTAGIGLAVVAILFSLLRWSFSFSIFLLAVVAVVGGLGGLGYQLFTQRSKSGFGLSGGSPGVYRSIPCPINGELIKKLQDDQEVLRNRLKEGNVETEWNKFEVQQERIKECLREEDLEGAFVGVCLALRILATAWRKSLTKTESFQPVFDRPSNR
ncbi:MAG: PP2C family protein-serine/threonine phosphatase [Gemmataceae bacterium]